MTAVLLLALAPGATARPASGERGYVRVHGAGTAVAGRGGDARVCQFYLDAFIFGTVPRIDWKVLQSSSKKEVLHGTLALANGFGHTRSLRLPNGSYRVTWTFPRAQGAAAHTDFRVSCQPSR